MDMENVLFNFWDKTLDICCMNRMNTAVHNKKILIPGCLGLYKIHKIAIWVTESTTHENEKLTPKRCCPFGYGYRIHRLHLCSGLRLLQRVSWYDFKPSDGEAPVSKVLGSMEYPFTAIAPSFTLIRSGSTLWGSINGLNRTVWYSNCFQTNYLNWIFRNRTVWLFTCVQTKDKK